VGQHAEQVGTAGQPVEGTYSEGRVAVPVGARRFVGDAGGVEVDMGVRRAVVNVGVRV
jgi:hypothetical protein